ncbi:MAG: helix-turn-helix domain-containing protein [Roseateles asaccharophilus]|uniref:helix-turn-helix domain-containing protein n=1 Tax=Roseateles asaccharophilus TaxID=582607 RepID=UPI00391BBF00
MSSLHDIGRAVRDRRTEVGLSQGQLAYLSGLSRQTLAGLENGTLNDLGFNRVARVTSVLGLESAPLNTVGHSKKRGLWMAAKTASASCAQELSPETLGEALVRGEVPPPFVPHLVHLLDEAPVQVVVMAVEEAAAGAHVAPKAVWRNVARLAQSLSVHRRALWTSSR